MSRLHLVCSSITVSVLTLAALAQRPSAPQVIDLKAADGAVLKATYFSAVHAGPGVLLLHQCNRQRKVWDELAQQLAAAGINVLSIDLRGFGESSGGPFDKLSPQEGAQVQQKWPGDIDTAFAYLVAQPGVKREVIGVGGASCGVNNSIQTARRHPSQVKSLVLLSGGTDYTGSQFLRQSPQLPILFAMADDDEFRPTVEFVPWLYSIASNPGNKFEHYSSGGHGADMFALHPELRSIIVDWYVTTLIKTPGHAPAAKRAAVPPAIETLARLEEPGGVDKLAQKLADARRTDPKAILFSETMANYIGYTHLQGGDVKGAVEIFKLNVTSYPGSPNVYDSLSDAYLADGQNDLARQNAKKAMELLASDTVDPEDRRNAIRDSAEQKLKQLGDGPR